MRPAIPETRSTRFFTRLTRRGALLGSAASVAALGVRGGAAQVSTPVPEASPTPNESISLLFVQYAGQTTLIPGSNNVHTLSMTSVIDQTVYFSDRPNRITGTAPTATFAAKFAELFAGSPPNATLVGHEEAGADAEEVVVLTLLSATYDPTTATLTYEVQLVDPELVSDRTFEQEPLATLDAGRHYADVSLFIDDITVEAQTDDTTTETISRPIAFLLVLQPILFIPPEDGS